MNVPAADRARVDPGLIPAVDLRATHATIKGALQHPRFVQQFTKRYERPAPRQDAEAIVHQLDFRVPSKNLQ